MQYHVRPLGSVCAATGEPLRPGGRVRSALVLRDGAQVRLDYALTAWSGPPPGTLGHWAVRVPLEDETQDTKPDADALFRLLETDDDADARLNPEQDRLRYAAAVMLLAEKRLELSDTRTDDGDTYLILTGSGGEGPFEVRDLQMDEAEVGGLEAAMKTRRSGCA